MLAIKLQNRQTLQTSFGRMWHEDLPKTRNYSDRTCSVACQLKEHFEKRLATAYEVDNNEMEQINIRRTQGVWEAHFIETCPLSSLTRRKRFIILI